MVAKIRSRFAAFIAACALALVDFWRKSHAIARSRTLKMGAPLPQRGIGVIDLVVALLIIMAILPSVITDWFNVQTTNWGATGTLWDLAPLLAIVGLLVWFKGRKQGGISGGI